MPQIQPLESFIRATYPALIRALMRKLPDRATAEDIAQDAYMALCQMPEFDSTRPDAVGFLHRKAAWLVQSQLRRASRYATHPLESEPLQSGGDLPQVVDAKDLQERVRRAVAALPRRYRVIVRRHLNGMSHAQIATTLALPIRTVYNRFHRAKDLLRHLLAGVEQLSC